MQWRFWSKRFFFGAILFCYKKHSCCSNYSRACIWRPLLSATDPISTQTFPSVRCPILTWPGWEDAKLHSLHFCILKFLKLLLEPFSCPPTSHFQPLHQAFKIKITLKVHSSHIKPLSSGGQQMPLKTYYLQVSRTCHWQASPDRRLGVGWVQPISSTFTRWHTQASSTVSPADTPKHSCLCQLQFDISEKGYVHETLFFGEPVHFDSCRIVMWGAYFSAIWMSPLFL